MLAPSIEGFLKSLDATDLPSVLSVGKMSGYEWRVYHAAEPVAVAVYYPALDELVITSGELPPGIALRTIRAAIVEAL